MTYLATLLAAFAATIASFGIFNDQPLPEPVFEPSLGAAVEPIAGVTYNLAGSGVSGSATSITLASLTIPQTSQKILDADLSDTFYITLEPGNRTRQEIASCTTVTQNANGTATLSGCSRGLSPITPYTASTTLQFAHSGGSQVIFSDPPQLFNQYPAKDNDETITGQWTFNTFPLTSSNSTSTYNTAGVSQLATPAQQAASTATSTGGNAAPLVLASKNATSTYNSATAVNVVPVTGGTGKLDSNFIATSTLYAYTLPTDRGASSTVPMSNGSGAATWNFPNYHLLAATTTTVAMDSATTTFTPGNFDNLFVVLISDANTNLNTQVVFNNDVAASYAIVRSTDYGTSSKVSGATNLSLDGVGASATTTSKYLQMNIQNPTSLRKSLTFNLTMSSDTTIAPIVTLGNGIWNNTTAKISSIRFVTSTGLPAGAKFYVYGY